MSPVCEQHDLMWKTMQEEIKEIRADVKDIKRDIKAVSELAQSVKVVDTRLKTVERLVYGGIGLTLIAVVGAILRLVVK